MITLAILYYLYLIVVLFFIIYSLFNIYHLLRFGFTTLTNFLAIILYISVAILVLSESFMIINTIDWSIPLLDLSNIFSFSF